MKNLSLKIALTALGMLSCGQPASAKAKPKTRRSPKIHKTDKGSTVGALVKGGLAGGVLGLGYLALSELLEDPKPIAWTPMPMQPKSAYPHEDTCFVPRPTIPTPTQKPDLTLAEGDASSTTSSDDDNKTVVDETPEWRQCIAPFSTEIAERDCRKYKVFNSPHGALLIVGLLPVVRGNTTQYYNVEITGVEEALVKQYFQQNTSLKVQEWFELPEHWNMRVKLALEKHSQNPIDQSLNRFVHLRGLFVQYFPSNANVNVTVSETLLLILEELTSLQTTLDQQLADSYKKQMLKLTVNSLKMLLCLKHSINTRPELSLNIALDLQKNLSVFFQISENLSTNHECFTNWLNRQVEYFLAQLKASPMTPQMLNQLRLTAAQQDDLI